MMVRMRLELMESFVPCSRVDGCRLDTPWLPGWRNPEMDAGELMPVCVCVCMRVEGKWLFQ